MTRACIISWLLIACSIVIESSLFVAILWAIVPFLILLSVVISTS